MHARDAFQPNKRPATPSIGRARPGSFSARFSTALSLATAAGLVAVLALTPVLARSKHRVVHKPQPAAAVRKVAPTALSAPHSTAAAQSATTASPAATSTPHTTSAPEAAEAPAAWSDTEVIAALRQCVMLLAPIAAEVEISQPLREHECGTPAPVVLHRLGSGPNKVELTPPAVVNCPMVVHLHRWLEQTLQPAAREILGSPIARLRNTSGYACRNRNGTLAHADTLSEHAKANAIDIGGFETADGRRIEVTPAWGPTERDRRREDAARTVATTQAQSSEPALKAIVATGSAAPTPAMRSRRTAHGIETAQIRRLGRGVGDVAPARAEPTSSSPEQAFLHRLHKEACAVFGTVLGPEANEAHRNHLHFDLLARRRSAYCE
jgi:hypothetical protein